MSEAPPVQPDAPDPGTREYADDDLDIQNGWLVENWREHTCGTAVHGYYGQHEPGCGWVPVMKVADLSRLLASLPDAVVNSQTCTCTPRWTGEAPDVPDRDCPVHGEQPTPARTDGEVPF